MFKVSRIPDYKINILKKNSVGQLNFNLALTDVPERWRTTRGEGIVIGILDTGMPMHRDLSGKVISAKDFTDDNNHIDREGHSTAVCGIIASEMVGSTGVTGIAPEARLVTGKVLNSNGVGKDEWLANGIRWCVSEGCHIINISAGAPASAEPKFSKTKAAVEYAASKGVYIFAAAGNDGSKKIDLPAKWNDVFCIVAIDKKYNVADFSNSGPEVDFSSLGVDVITTYLDDQYSCVSGTSFASPTAAAIGALVLAPDKISDWWEFRARLIKLATCLGDKPWNESYGFGNITFGEPTNFVDPYTKEYGLSKNPIYRKKPFWKRLLFWI